MKTTIASVNKALKQMGVAERLAKEPKLGYFYFFGGNSAGWLISGVYGVANVSDLTVDQWINEYNELKAK